MLCKGEHPRGQVRLPAWSSCLVLNPLSLIIRNGKCVQEKSGHVKAWRSGGVPFHCGLGPGFGMEVRRCFWQFNIYAEPFFKCPTLASRCSFASNEVNTSIYSQARACCGGDRRLDRATAATWSLPHPPAIGAFLTAIIHKSHHPRASNASPCHPTPPLLPWKRLRIRSMRCPMAQTTSRSSSSRPRRPWYACPSLFSCARRRNSA